MTLPLAQAAYSNPSLPPKTMMKIYKAATPDGGSNLNVLKFSQVMLENGLTLRKPSTHISPHPPYSSPISPDISHINVLERPQAPLLPSSRQVMLENGLTLKSRPPAESFDEQGQLKGTKVRARARVT